MLTAVEAKYVRYMSSFSGREVRVLRVGKSLTAPFRQIADAIRLSRPYDRVEVESGKYFEALSINHPLELCSAGDGEPPVITTRGPCLTIKTDGPVLVDCITIIAKGTRASDSQAIVIHSGKPVIQSCDLSSVYVMNDAAPQITHCRICNSDYGCGLSITCASGGVYSNNYINGHNEESIHIASSGRPTLSHNRITQKPGTSSSVVIISGRLVDSCEPFFHDNIIRGTTVATEYLDPYAAHSPEMLVEQDPRSLSCLVRVNNGAAPHIFGNLLSNGITGFHFVQCSVPPERFSGNRILNCIAWGIAVGGRTSLDVWRNDVRYCGGGIRVSAAAARASDDEKEDAMPRVTLTQCNMQKNFHYGILINHSAVSIKECSVVKSTVGIAFLGNCSASRVQYNTLSENSTAAFSIMRHGVATIEDNTVSGTKGESMYGIFVMDSSTMTLRSNTVTGMATSVYVRDKSHLIAEKNVLSDASVHHIVLVEASHAALRKNTIQCSSCAAVVVTEGSQGSMHDNVMYSSMKEGILVERKSKFTIKGNGISSMGEGIRIRRGGHADVEENDISLSQLGIVVKGKGTTCTVKKNRLRGITSVAVHASECAELTASENTLLDQCNLGFQVAGEAKVLLERDTLQRCSEGAVSVDGAGSHCRVVDCSIEDSGYGVLCAGSARSTVTGNTLRGCTLFGVKCDSDGETLVSGNSIYGSGTGIILAACGDVHDNTTDGCGVGIAALLRARATLRDHCTSRCAIGLRVHGGTCVAVERLFLRHSREAGVSVDGPAPAVTLRGVSVEHSAGAGVLVRAGGACRFERCVVRDGPGVGICAERFAGAAVFDDCAVVDHPRGIVCGGDGAEGRAAGRTAGPLFERCTVAGAACAVGVEGAAGGAAELRLCRVHASTGVGVALAPGAILRVVRCDIADCARGGIVSDAHSAAAVEDSTIERCDTGVRFTAASDESDVAGNGTTLSRVTVRDCSRAGLWCEPRGAGSMHTSVIEGCGEGTVLESASRAVLCDTAVRASAGYGVRITGAVAKDAALQRVVVTESGAAGIFLESSAQCDVKELEKLESSELDELDPITAVCVEGAEITKNAGGGVVFAASGRLESCVVAHNGNVGVRCCDTARPLLRTCRLHSNTESNLDSCDTACPLLFDCAVEDAATGVRVGAGAGVRMTGCVSRRLETAIAIASFASAVSFATAAMTSALEDCKFGKCSVVGIRVARGARLEMRACTVEESPDGVVLEAGANGKVAACTFTGNIRAITATASVLDVRSSSFMYQLHYAIRVQDGDGKGEVEICDNSFTGSAQQSIVLAAAAPFQGGPEEEVEEKEKEEEEEEERVENGKVEEEEDEERGGKEKEKKYGETRMIVTVCGNAFLRDVCSVLVEQAVVVFLYNNTFRECRTGLFLRSTDVSTRIISNIFESNQCGCLCEENATAGIWRNTFCGNTKNGLVLTSDSKPLVVANVFKDHSADAICVHEGGGGHFAMNEISSNACGIRLQDTGDTVIVTNNTFQANSTAVQLAHGAAVHVIACVFLSSKLTDVSAKGSLSPVGCVLAYNCFASPKVVAVELVDEAALLLYRSVLLGTDATGMRIGPRARAEVSECLFYELQCGVVAAESAEGHVGQCVFVSCTTAVEARALARTEFHTCAFLARRGSRRVGFIPPMVQLCAEAQPSFIHCSFVGKVAETGTLVHSSAGGGCVKNSVFAAAAKGSAVVLLEGRCSTGLHHNTFLAGSIGVVMSSSSEATVATNVFYRHEMAAVQVMTNAKGKLCGNTFAQPLNGGGILAGNHAAELDANRTSEVGNRKTLSHMDAESLAEMFGEWLAEAPPWARRIIGSVPSAAVLPSTLLAQLNAEAERRGSNLNGESNDAEGDGKQQGAQEEPQAKGSKRDTKPRGEKKRKKSRGSESREAIVFAVSDAVMEVPRRLDAALLAWVEHNGIVLSSTGPAPPPSPPSPESLTEPPAAPEETAVGPDKQKTAEEAPVRGDDAAGLETEVRGTSMVVRPCDASELVSRASRGSDDMKGKPKFAEPHEHAHGFPTIPMPAVTDESGERSTLPGASAVTRPQTAKPAVRRHCRALPPPLRSTGVHTDPRRLPRCGCIATLTACLRKCRASKKPSRTPRKKRDADLAKAELEIDPRTGDVLRIPQTILASLLCSDEEMEEVEEIHSLETASTPRARMSYQTSESVSLIRGLRKGSQSSPSLGTLSVGASAPVCVAGAQSITLEAKAKLDDGGDDNESIPQRPSTRVGNSVERASPTGADDGGALAREGKTGAAVGIIKSSGTDAKGVNLVGVEAEAPKSGFTGNAGTLDMESYALRGSKHALVTDASGLSGQVSAKGPPTFEKSGGKRRMPVPGGKDKRRGKMSAIRSGSFGKGATQQSANASKSSQGKTQLADVTDDNIVDKKGIKEESTKLSTSASCGRDAAARTLGSDKGAKFSPVDGTAHSNALSHEATGERMALLDTDRIGVVSASGTLPPGRAPGSVVKALRDVQTLEQGEGEEYYGRGEFSDYAVSKDGESASQGSARVATAPMRNADGRIGVGESWGDLDTLGAACHGAESASFTHSTAQGREGDAYSESGRDGSQVSGESARLSNENITSQSQMLSLFSPTGQNGMSTSSSTLPQLTASSLQSIRGVQLSLASQRTQKMCEDVEAIVCGSASVTAIRSSQKSPSTHADEVDSPVSTSSDASLTGSEATAEVEDIIALLRWLADMRAQRLLSQARFQEAVRSMQINTRVPFYIDDANGTPTVMVRLPQTWGETVAIPLLGSQMVAQLNPQEGTEDDLNFGSPSALPTQPQPLPCDAPESAVGERHSPTPTSNHLPPLPVHANPLRASFTGHMDVPQVFGAVESTRLLGDHYMPSAALSRNGARRGTQISRGRNSGARAAHAQAPRHAVAFNPALPMETSPYVKNPRVSTFIAAGTTKFMM